MESIIFQLREFIEMLESDRNTLQCMSTKQVLPTYKIIDNYINDLTEIIKYIE